MKQDLQSESTGEPSGKICEIITEHSQIRRVLAKPLPQPMDVEDSAARDRVLMARDQQRKERERFVVRYERAIRGFLGKKLGNADKVDQIYSFFMDKCMAGKLCNYSPEMEGSPEKRSFRKYLKTVLRNCCYEFHRNNLNEDAWVQIETCITPSQESGDAEADATFDRELAKTLFQRSLDAIEHVDHLYHTVLKLVINAINQDEKQPSSTELATVLSAEGRKPVSEQNARKIKSRATKMFAKQLIIEVSQLIQTSNLDELENALVDIGILKYCKKALHKMRQAEALQVH